MTEKEKAQKGYLYDANYDKDLAIERIPVNKSFRRKDNLQYLNASLILESKLFHSAFYKYKFVYDNFNFNFTD